MYDEIKLAIIGCGKWGLNHLLTAFNLLGNNLVAVCDIDETKKDLVKNISPNIIFYNRIESLINNTEINSWIISTPAITHYELAKIGLKNNKNVLVEKPLTLISKETTELIQIAEKNKLKLMVGHVLLYHPAILKIKDLIDNNFIGKLQYIYSNRLNLGTLRKDENILWSFAPHDISVIQFLIKNNPIEINAFGSIFLQNNIEDTTITLLRYPNNIFAHIFVSWLHPFKEQRLVIIGDSGMIVFEDSLKNEKLKYFKKGYNIKNGKMEKFESEYKVLDFENKLPLEEEQKHFFESILNNTTPRTDGYHAKSVLDILEESSKKLY